tara:strand:+ start:4033 stop:4302 length:270 start_codon:yes stop_codon:yes gene_type:complete
MKFVARLIGGKGDSASWGVFSSEGGHAWRAFRTKKQAEKHARMMNNSEGVKRINQLPKLKPHPSSQTPEGRADMKSFMAEMEEMGEKNV